MGRKFFDSKTVIIYFVIILSILFLSLGWNHSVTVFADKQILQNTVVIDAGHGGVDGGAVSCTGVFESTINLEISTRLNDLMRLLGIHTVMIRDTDRSVYTSGETIAAKKISDIKERVRIVNSTPNALLISIHQNNFQQRQYFGSQVFYNEQSGSKELAEMLQSSFRANLDPNNRRQIKKSSGVYLMEHIDGPGVLIECGFLSNQTEEALLRNGEYQKKLSCVIASSVSQYLNT